MNRTTVIVIIVVVVVIAGYLFWSGSRTADVAAPPATTDAPATDAPAADAPATSGN